MISETGYSNNGDASKVTDLPVVAVSNVSKRFGIVQALNGVSANFYRGRITALVGENGAGKSTLMRIMEGEHRPDDGTIYVDGQAVSISSPREAHALGIRVIHQEPEIIPELTVAENIFVGDLRARYAVLIDREDLERRAQQMLDAFGVAGVLKPCEICRGLGPAQRQLIEIMRALRPGARLLAFDEPTSSLTEEEAVRLFALIRKLKSEGVSIIYISHRLREVMMIADSTITMRDGRSVGEAPMQELDEAKMVRLMVGRPISDLFQRRKRELGPVQVVLDRMSTDKISDISLSLRAGEILGLGGLVGAGRTEVARAIMGLDTVRSGSMVIAGKPYSPKNPADAIRAGIGLVPEDRRQEALLLLQAVRDNISLVVPDKVSRWGFFSWRKEAELVHHHVEGLRIKTPSINQAVGKRSGGNQQKVVFARWQARGPKILILDEPTRGIDIGAKAEIYRLIESLADEGMAVLLISSEMPELLGLSDRIVILRSGKLAGELHADVATEEQILDLAMRTTHKRAP